MLKKLSHTIQDCVINKSLVREYCYTSSWTVFNNRNNSKEGRSCLRRGSNCEPTDEIRAKNLLVGSSGM